MSKKKEKLLNKYLDKKIKQRKKDEILAEIAIIEQRRLKIIQNKDIDDSLKRNKFNATIKEDIEDNVLLKNNILDDFNKEVDISNENIDLNNEIKNNNFDNEKNALCDKNSALFENFIETINKKNFFLEVPITIENLNDETLCCDNIDLEDFLGEKVFWEDVECPHRPPEIESFRKILPIYFERSNIISKVQKNTVISIKGETGCGKTTQIPQFLYEGGFKRLIGVTQPRRISTISISNRINYEMGEKKSGFQIRYESTVNKDTAIKIMTDGILLKEIQSDFLLSKYSVILLDEIHERSANMDILISLLSRIVKMRKQCNDELKLVLMSATSMIDELSKFFDKILSIEIPSNSHIVSIFYENKNPVDIVQAAYDRISKILKLNNNQANDSILCFLPDKSDIYSLLKKLSDRFNDCVILPLHSALSKQEQGLIYKQYDQRKIILSTNIAETSITIPDIYYVVDSGLVKRKYYGMMNIIEYSIEYISKSSALQRAGRAGRTGPGICYRLYTGNFYSLFEELDTPKILHVELDEIILSLISLGIEDVYRFPFVNRPNDESLTRSLNDLKRIGILNFNFEITRLGQYISNLPFPPRISKLLCFSNTQHILLELIDLACLMTVKIELKRNLCNKNYYTSEKSDLLVILKIFRDFEKDKNKKAFCTRMNLNLSIWSEVLNLQKFMYSKFNLKVEKKNFLTNNTKNEIRRIIYLAFSDRVALPYDHLYWYKKNPLYVPESSIDTEGEYVVFEYLVKGTKKLYMKNITIVDKEWFL